ncbi:hypothetical protein OPV22_022200 [Ensete ventricosum]|uniref:Uncharacterized protein n=1 Tax=Ensete ventricosum TaxID=4639 RepID=A0AAV8QMZ4_ENSVE|nr:hypothetical protein OPV22_022200 [Ensete ventricosum]
MLSTPPRLSSELAGRLLYPTPQYRLFLIKEIGFIKNDLSPHESQDELLRCTSLTVPSHHFPRRVRRLLARDCISIYQEDVLELAKLDFNLLQSLHREEA